MAQLELELDGAGSPSAPPQASEDQEKSEIYNPFDDLPQVDGGFFQQYLVFDPVPDRQ